MDYISGTGIGGLLAAFYCRCFSPDQHEEEALSISNICHLLKLVDLIPLRCVLIDYKKIKQYLTELLGDITSFPQRIIPLGLCAVDLCRARDIHFTSGELIPAILATICFPGIFPTVEFEGKKLIDEGILNNVPVNIENNFGAKFIIGMDVEPNRLQQTDLGNFKPLNIWRIPAPGAFPDLYNSELLMISRITEINLKQCKPDCLITPEIPLDISDVFGFSRTGESIVIVDQAAQEAIPQIIEALSCQR